MNQIARPPPPEMTADEFLAWPGDGSGRKFELVDGRLRQMSPATADHSLIQANLAWMLLAAIRGAGLKLKVGTEGAVIPGACPSGNVRVPNLVVSSAEVRSGAIPIADPVLLVEVLSPTNRRATRENIKAFKTIPAASEVLVIESTRIEAEIHRRGPSGDWSSPPEIIRRGGVLRLASTGLDLPLDDAYIGTSLA